LEFLAPRRRASVTVAIPASTTADTPHLRERTLKVGLMGRALAIFRVSRVIVYRDLEADQASDSRLMERLLSYMATPQYLRKMLFRITPELRYAGILPPLRTPNHPLRKFSRELKVGEFREGFVVKSSRSISEVNIGVEKPALIQDYHPVNARINVRVSRLGDVVEVEPVPLESIDVYWGFQVEAADLTLDEVLRRGKYGLTVATSKHGKPLKGVTGSLVRRWLDARSVLLAFGSPTEGVGEILSRRGIKAEELFNFVVNTIRSQGTETVRVEEALISSLSTFNSMVED